MATTPALLCAALWAGCSTAVAGFVHPGVLVSAQQLNLIRDNVLVKREGPQYVAYQKAIKSRFGKLHYVPFGPPPDGIIVCGSYNHPNIGCSNESIDTATAYLQALLWAINGNQTYADNAIKILNLYAHGLKGYGKSGTPPKPYNAPLQAAWSGMMYSKAAELLVHGGQNGTKSGWNTQDQQVFREMLTTVTVPLIYGGSGCNGNWELSFMDALIGIAVFTENQTMFDHAVNFWSQRVPAYFWTISDGPYPIHVPRGNENWNDTGPTGHGGGGGSWYGQTVFNATTNGVCQETCRDFGHTQMGMASAMYTAETAYIQGHDLWKAEQVRLVPAMEFHSRFLLLKKSHDTNQTSAEHYETLLNDKGTNDPPRPSTPAPSYVCSGAGVHLSLSPTMEVGFNAYHNRMGIALPTTERHIDTQVRTMQDPGSQLIFMYETLTHGAASK